jgi:hypothetical protein
VTFLKAQQRTQFQAASVKDAEEAVQIAVAQYKAGIVDFTRVTQLETTLVTQQDTLAQAQGEIVAFRLTTPSSSFRLSSPAFRPVAEEVGRIVAEGRPVSQPISDTPSSPRPRSPAGYVGLFLVSTGGLWFLLWWNHHGIAVVSSLISLTVTGLYQIGVTSPGTLTAAVSMVGGLAITIWAYLANRPRPTATPLPRPAPRIDPNSPIEMPLPPGFHLRFRRKSATAAHYLPSR